MAAWHIITSEYPPQPGGVSDYTQQIAHGLADAGDEVHVWCPRFEAPPGKYETANSARVFVHREFGGFTSRDLRNVDKLMGQFNGPKRLLVQWVPHGYGYRSMNLAFCLWLWRRARKQADAVELMVHEPFLAFAEGSWKQSGVAGVHRLMTVVLLKAAGRVWMSIPAWEARLRPYALGRALPFRWLPVMSSVPVVCDPTGVDSVKAKYAPEGQQLVGHFGTYDRNISELLLRAVPSLLQANPECRMLLLGRGSEGMREEFLRRYPALTAQIHAAGTLAPTDLSLHVSACDLLLQPYVDGVSSRRTSVMVGLAHGVPILTTVGRLTDSLWAESEAVVLVPVADTEGLVEQASRVLADDSRRRKLAVAAKKLYDDRFAIERTIATLREAAASS